MTASSKWGLPERGERDAPPSLFLFRSPRLEMVHWLLNCGFVSGRDLFGDHSERVWPRQKSHGAKEKPRGLHFQTQSRRACPELVEGDG
jgi:hypothetical protein